MTVKSELARLARYDELLSSVMNPDFNDWFQNSKEEWPEVAKFVIENLRQHLDEANTDNGRLYDRIYKINNPPKV